MKTTPPDEWKLITEYHRDVHKSPFTEAICAHGIGHHNGVHGCDGCCEGWPEEISNKVSED